MTNHNPTDGSPTGLSSTGSREPGAGGRLLVAIREGLEGERLAGRIARRIEHPGTWVQGWSGLIDAFYPIPPGLVMVDVGLLGTDAKGVAQLDTLSAEVPGLPVAVVGDPSTVPADTLLRLGSIGIERVIGVESLSPDRIAGMMDWTVAGRVLRSLRANCARPVPPFVADAITHAMERRPTRLRVGDLAARLGYSSRWVRVKLSRIEAPPPGVLITWGRVLWAVHDLCTHPTRSGDRVAWDLGFASAAVLGNALHRRLGVRIRQAREKGIDWAVGRFVHASGLCEPGTASKGSG